jgi:hypothetical protein
MATIHKHDLRISDVLDREVREIAATSNRSMNSVLNTLLLEGIAYHKRAERHAKKRKEQLAAEHTSKLRMLDGDGNESNGE